ncbi:Zinc finger, C2H2 type [compost metagenome]
MTGLYYYGYRYFAPWLSRWISPDPAGAVDGLNLYGFVGNSPVSFTDSDGRMRVPKKVFVGAGGVIRSKGELALDAQQDDRRLIVEELQPALADLVASVPVIVDSDSQDSQSSTVSLGTALSFVGLVEDLEAPSSLEEIELAPLTVGAPASPAPGPSVVSLGVTNPHTCSVCGKSLANRRSLGRHLKLHSGQKPYVCDESGCSQAFVRAHDLVQHRRKHSGEKPFKCNEPGCHQAYWQSSDLMRHHRVHTGDKPFKCTAPECNAAFTQQTGLTVHRRIHTSERPFKCTAPECNAAFTQQVGLTVHRRIHTDERPFRCEVLGCNEAFRQQSNLTMHRNRKHAV